MADQAPAYLDGIEVTPFLNEQGAFSYLAQDTHSGEIYVLGEEEYTLCGLLSEGLAPEAIQKQFESTFAKPLSADHLQSFIRQLSARGRPADALFETENAEPEFSPRTKVRSLGDPDRLVRFLETWFGWCFSWPGAVVVGCVVFMAAGIGIRYGDDLFFELMSRWEMGRYIPILILGVVCANLVAEIVKSTACKHHGGSVHDLQMVMVLNIIPVFYADLSDVRWMANKKTQLKILSAGLLVQVLLFALSIILWHRGVPWTNASMVWLVAMVILFHALFFNGNPLLYRDAYFILTAWLEITNLRTRAFRAAKAWITRRPLPEPLTAREMRAFLWYAALSLLFSVLLVLGILLLVGYVLITTLEGVGGFLVLIVCYRVLSSLVGKRRKAAA